MDEITKKVRQLVGCQATGCYGYNYKELDGGNCAISASPWYRMPHCYIPPNSLSNDNHNEEVSITHSK